MRLDELKFELIMDNVEECKFRSPNGSMIHVLRVNGVANTIDIYEDDRRTAWNNRRRWYALDDLTAQAVLFELFRESDNAAG